MSDQQAYLVPQLQAMMLFHFEGFDDAGFAGVIESRWRLDDAFEAEIDPLVLARLWELAAEGLEMQATDRDGNKIPLICQRYG